MRNRPHPAILLPLAVLAGCQSMSAPAPDALREEA